MRVFLNIDLFLQNLYRWHLFRRDYFDHSNCLYKRLISRQQCTPHNEIFENEVMKSCITISRTMCSATTGCTYRRAMGFDDFEWPRKEAILPSHLVVPWRTWSVVLLLFTNQFSLRAMRLKFKSYCSHRKTLILRPIKLSRYNCAYCLALISH